MHLACDFECTTVEPYEVYLVTVENVIDGTQQMFENLDEFEQFLNSIEPSTLYFHNGENYDFHFLQWWAYEYKRFKYKINKYHKLEFTLEEFERTKTGRIKKHKGQPVKKTIQHTLVDTTNIFKLSLKQLGMIIGLHKGLGHIDTPLIATFGTDKDGNDFYVEKIGDGDKDYQVHYQNLRDAIKQNQWDKYAMRDVEILAKVIDAFDIINHVENNRGTIASIAYHELLTYEPYALQVESYDKNKDYLNAANQIAKQAYKGGIAWTNPLHANKLIKGKGFHLDYTSMYPSIYIGSGKYPLPNNRPVPSSELDNHQLPELYIIRYGYLKAKCKPGKFPLLKARTDAHNHQNSDGYYEVFEGPISLTKPEVEYLYANYNVIEERDVKVFYYEKNHQLMKALKQHGKKWYNIKNNPKSDSEKLYAKMMLNTVYGYLGFYDKQIKTYDYEYKDQHIVKKLKGHALTGITTAEVPAAAFITAYGRVKLANDINRFGIENVVCCDTDSLFLINYKSLDGYDIEESLGFLKLEHEFDEIISIKPKTYCIAKDGLVVAQATAGSNYKFDKIEDFKAGAIFESTEREVGKGGIGIVKIKKMLGV